MDFNLTSHCVITSKSKFNKGKKIKSQTTKMTLKYCSMFDTIGKRKIAD
jgi:hypothetical protein